MKSFVPRETSATSDDGPKLPPPAGSDAEPVAQSEEATPAGEQAPDEAAPDGQQRHDRNAEVSFHGQKRSNAMHVSTTDPEARLYRKGQGKEAKLSYLGHTPFCLSYRFAA